MKKTVYSFIFLFFLTASISGLFAQSAHVQFLNNSPDSSLASVDVYLNGSLTFAGLNFRQATEFIGLPSTGGFSIGIAPAGSSSASDTVKNLDITFNTDSSYYIIINGVRDTAGYVHNAGGASLLLSLVVYAHATLTCNPLYDCSVQYFNGSYDAKTFNVYDREDRVVLFSHIGYSQFGTHYVPEKTAPPVVLDLTDTATSNNIQSTYLLSLSGLDDQSVLVFSSGFQNSSLNHNGPSFGLFALLNNGTVVQLIDTAIADLQIINNSPDTSSYAYDVYVNSTLLSSTLYFRFATPYLDVPGNIPIHIGIAPAGSSSVTEVIDSFTMTLLNGKSYVSMLDGVLDTAGYKHNPDKKNISLNLFTKPNARQIADDSTKVDFFIFHGGTDEPAINIKIPVTTSLLADSIVYGDTSAYSEKNDSLYYFEITVGGNSNDIIATYIADLRFLTAKSITIFTSGFVDSVHNHNGASFGLFAVLNDGNVIQFPLLLSYGQVQFIQNSADPADSLVDIYINGNPAISSFKFRKATSFNGVPADVTMDIGIAPYQSLSALDTFKNFHVTVSPDSYNVLMLNGVKSTTGFAVNPDGKNILLSLSQLSNIRVASGASNKAGVRMVGASTDEPANDFIWNEVLPPLFSNVEYGDSRPDTSVAASTLPVYMAPANNDNTITKKYSALFAAYGGASLTVFSSGFYAPSSNNNGPAFGLYAADTSGNVFPLTDISSVNNISGGASVTLYPNPASDNLIINAGNESIFIQLLDISGREIKSFGRVESNSYANFSLEGIAGGLYFIRTISSSVTKDSKLVIEK